MAGTDRSHSAHPPAAHDAPAHGGGHDDDALDAPLGPPDVRAWAAALAGVVVAALVALSLFVATQT